MTIFERLFRLLGGKPRTASDCYWTAPNTVGLADRYAHAVDLDNPQRLQTVAGPSICVHSLRDNTVELFITDAATLNCATVILRHTEAQWLLKAIRQQNNIVKQRLGISPYNESLDERRSKPLEYSKEPLWKDGSWY